MKKHGLGPILTLCVVLLVALDEKVLVKAHHHSTPTKKENSTYAITIETTCTLGAETSDQIHIRFGDTKSNDILIHHLNTKHVTQLDPLEPQRLDDVPRVPFRACTIDQFHVTSTCVESPVCYLYLKLAGSDDWRPGFAQVRVMEGPDLSSKYFYFRRFVPRSVWHGFDMCDDRVVTPFGIRHKKKVFHKEPPISSLVP